MTYEQVYLVCRPNLLCLACVKEGAVLHGGRCPIVMVVRSLSGGAAVPNGTPGFGGAASRIGQLPGSFQAVPLTQSAAAPHAPFPNTQSYGGYSQVCNPYRGFRCRETVSTLSSSRCFNHSLRLEAEDITTAIHPPSRSTGHQADDCMSRD